MWAATPGIIKQIFCVLMLRSNTDKITTWFCWPTYSVNPTSVNSSRSKPPTANGSHAYSNNQPGKWTAGQTPPRQQFPSQQYLPKGPRYAGQPYIYAETSIQPDWEPWNSTAPELSKDRGDNYHLQKEEEDSNTSAYSGWRLPQWSSKGTWMPKSANNWTGNTTLKWFTRRG